MSAGDEAQPGASDESVAYFVSHHDAIVRGAGHTRLVTAILAVTFLVLLTLFIGVGAIGAAHEATESTRIQRHGIRVTATVLSIHTTTHTYTRVGGRSSFGTTSHSYHSVLTVQLERTVNLQTTAEIRSPDSHPAQVGDTLTVLLDPNDPVVGEFPGHPVETAHGWLFLAASAAGLLALDGYVTVKIIGARRRRGLPARQNDR